LPVKKKAKKNKVEITESNVVYLGHIPQGFADREMKSFFAQFGGVRRTKLFKSEKTNRSKGYAFIQFDEAQVAATAAEAMDGYFLGDRKLVCHVVPPEKLHSGMFLPPKQVTPKPALAPAMPNIPNIHHIGSRDQRDMVPEAPRSKNAAKRAIKSSVKRQAAWEAAGIDF
jgi:RNA recognition motif-containing protein